MNTNVFAVAAILSAALSTSAGAASLLVNGGFETGDFTGWTVTTASGSDGNLSVTTGGTSPNSGSGVAAPTDGVYYAITDQTGPGAYALVQSFVAAASMTLSFDFFAQAFAGLSDTGDLTFTGGANQHARVDILTAAAGAFDLGTSIVQTLIAPIANGSPDPFASYTFALNSLTAGTTYQLRFAQVDNQDFFQMGVDNVELTAAPIPVPAAGLLLLTAVGGLGIAARRRKSA